MAIVSSELEFDRPQADGRRWLRIAHTDHLGEKHSFVKKVAAGTVVVDEIADQQLAIAEQLADGEVKILEEEGPANDNLQTVALDHADRPTMIRRVVRRGFREYMDSETTINRRFRLAQFLEGLPAAVVSAQLGVPVASVVSLQASMGRLLALQSSLSEFVGEIRP